MCHTIITIHAYSISLIPYARIRPRGLMRYELCVVTISETCCLIGITCCTRVINCNCNWSSCTQFARKLCTSSSLQASREYIQYSVSKLSMHRPCTVHPGAMAMVRPRAPRVVRVALSACAAAGCTSTDVLLCCPVRDTLCSLAACYGRRGELVPGHRAAVSRCARAAHQRVGATFPL
eukprot:COSAG02_NODE_122_length_35306_cov_98.280967_30_plen_178_part_00